MTIDARELYQTALMRMFTDVNEAHWPLVPAARKRRGRCAWTPILMRTDTDRAISTISTGWGARPRRWTPKGLPTHER